MKRLTRFLRLPIGEKKLHFKAMSLVVVTRIGLWLLPYRMVEKSVAFIASRAKMNGDADWKLIRSVSSSVKSCSKYVPHATCLTQALAARTLLRLNGYDSELKIGVVKDAANLAAHAWIEIDGRIVIGKQHDHGRYFVLRPSNSLTL